MRLDSTPTFHGHVVWLTPQQGGRSSGPPATPDTQDYAATAFVPPATADSGLASFVLRVADRGSWTSAAEGAWLVPRDNPRFDVQPGSVVVVTEGPRVVAYFHVESLRDEDHPQPVQARGRVGVGTLSGTPAQRCRSRAVLREMRRPRLAVAAKTSLADTANSRRLTGLPYPP